MKGRCRGFTSTVLTGSVVEFDPSSFALESDDAVVLAGTDESVQSFESQFLA